MQRPERGTLAASQAGGSVASDFSRTVLVDASFILIFEHAIAAIRGTPGEKQLPQKSTRGAKKGRWRRAGWHRSWPRGLLFLSLGTLPHFVAAGWTQGSIVRNVGRS
jgi:hypothetical protein